MIVAARQISLFKRVLPPINNFSNIIHHRLNHDEKKPSDQVGSKLESDLLPQKRYKWGDPVPQKMFKKIPSEYHGLEESEIGEETEWLPVYQVPRLRVIRMIVKLKISMTLISTYMFGVRVYDFLLDPSLDLFRPVGIFGITLGGLIMLGDFCRRLIVQTYVTEDNRYVRLTRLTFFAKRMDLILPTASVLPLTENNVSRRKFILKLKTIPPEGTIQGFDRPEFYDESFNICLKYGGVLDVDRFEDALGHIYKYKPGM